MRITGPLPENIRRLMPQEERTTPETMTMDQANEIFDARTEAKLQVLIDSYFKLHGIVAFRQRMDKKSNMTIGTPDFLVAVIGKMGVRAIGIEVKVGNNKQSVDQLTMEQRMKASGAWEYYVVRSLEEVKEIFKN